MHMHRVFGDIEAKLIGRSMDMTTLYSTSCHDHGEAIRIMITPKQLSFGCAPFAERCTTKLTTNNDQGIVKQSTLFQIFDQGGYGFIHGGTFSGQSITNVFIWIGSMEIPTPVKQLHKTHAFFG